MKPKRHLTTYLKLFDAVWNINDVAFYFVHLLGILELSFAWDISKDLCVRIRSHIPEMQSSTQGNMEGRGIRYMYILPQTLIL